MQPQGPEQSHVENLPAVPQTAAPPAREVRITVDQLAQLPESEEKKQWINALVQAETGRLRYAQDRQFALDAYNSGQFDDLKKLTPQQGVALAITKLQIGWDWGLTRADAIRSIYMVGGRPSLENELVAFHLNRAGIFWEPVFQYEEVVDDKKRPWKKCISCTLWLKTWNREARQYVAMLDRDGNQISVSFGQADADHALIWEGGKQIPLSQKWNFQSWAKDMYYWKCIARVKKYHAPGVLRGVSIREEAVLETIPVDAMPPELLPPDLQPAGDEPLHPEVQPRQSLRDKVVTQESFLDQPGPGREPGEGE